MCVWSRPLVNRDGLRSGAASGRNDVARGRAGASGLWTSRSFEHTGPTSRSAPRPGACRGRRSEVSNLSLVCMR